MMSSGVEATLFSSSTQHLGKISPTADNALVNHPHHSHLQRYRMLLESDLEDLDL